jgi:putative heme-binding domain-containing protein
VRSGWSQEQRRRYVAALDELYDHAEGGLSLAKFVDAIREHALASLAAPDLAARDARRKQLGSARPIPAAAPATPARAWSRDELAALLRGTPSGRSFDGGKRAFASARCADCHRIAGEGGATGPDLTGAGSRFSRSDLLESLLEPSRVVSDQYRDIEILTKDGELYVGRIEQETARAITLRRLPPQEDLVELPLDEIESRRAHPLSRMPSGLLDTLSEADVLDLFAYVLSGADPADKCFAH